MRSFEWAAAGATRPCPPGRFYHPRLEILETRLSLGDAVTSGVIGTSWLAAGLAPANRVPELSAIADVDLTADRATAVPRWGFLGGEATPPPSRLAAWAAPDHAPASQAAITPGASPQAPVGDACLSSGKHVPADAWAGQLPQLEPVGPAPVRGRLHWRPPAPGPIGRAGRLDDARLSRAPDSHLPVLPGPEPARSDGHGPPPGSIPYWVDAMQQVRQNYNDTYGGAVAISRFGDSITVSQAFFQPLAPPSQGGRTYVNLPPEAEAALKWIRTAAPNEAWHWQGADVDQHGAQGGVLSDWPLGPVPANWPDQIDGERKVDYWLRRDNPAIAVIMFGTNDLPQQVTPDDYADHLWQTVVACEANGTIPILTTPPPRHDFEDGSPENQDRADAFHQAVWDVAAWENVPVIDFHDEILARNPHNPPYGTWDGADPTWDGYTGYEVPTSISRDGIHPSNWSAGQGDFVDGLNTNGYELRNYMTLLATQEVYDWVIAPP